mmetsp:Transcript_20296/g.26336  ORF Transcript_20296/g.26336 Transcript_20296/m.26336 type:complete len:84 (-) Transcript_20296:86-337(-)
MADTLWLQDQHENLAKSCSELLHADGILVSTYMHHDDQSNVAPSFFQIAHENYGFEVSLSFPIDLCANLCQSPDGIRRRNRMG